MKYKVIDPNSSYFGKVLEAAEQIKQDGKLVGYSLYLNKQQDIKAEFFLEQITLHTEEQQPIGNSDNKETWEQEEKANTKKVYKGIMQVKSYAKENGATIPEYAIETDESAPYNNDTIVNFGNAYKGETLGDCKAGWLMWCYNNLNKDRYARLHEYIEDNLDSLDKEAQSEYEEDLNS